jgi:hypothetical protein
MDTIPAERLGKKKPAEAGYSKGASALWFFKSSMDDLLFYFFFVHRDDDGGRT